MRATVSANPAMAAAILAAACAWQLSGCAIGQGPAVQTRVGLACVDDSQECIRQRQATLKSMLDDPSRSWVRESPTPEAYASGVRLFAYKTKKKELSCEELARGKLEADTARPSLNSAGSRLTHAQVARGAMLATEISRELQNEMSRRCKKA